jgi:hypothetical protein
VKAAGLLEERNDLATSELISMIRAAAVDVLRGIGMDRAEENPDWVWERIF